VRAYALSGSNRVRVHPNSYQYHFDVMAKWGDSGNILLISFPAQDIGGLLRASQAPGHELVILLPEAENLIEITARGARDSTPREDYRLSDAMRERMLVSKPIQHTRWELADAFTEDFVADYRHGLFVQMTVLLLLFGVFSLVIGWAMHRNDRVRRSAERVKDEFVSVVSHELRTP